MAIIGPFPTEDPEHVENKDFRAFNDKRVPE